MFRLLDHFFNVCSPSHLPLLSGVVEDILFVGLVERHLGLDILLTHFEDSFLEDVANRGIFSLIDDFLALLPHSDLVVI